MLPAAVRLGAALHLPSKNGLFNEGRFGVMATGISGEQFFSMFSPQQLGWVAESHFQ